MMKAVHKYVIGTRWRSLFIAFFLLVPLMSSAQTNNIAVSPIQQKNRFPRFDREVLGFVEQHEVPGMAVAVSFKGELKYACGYGYANLQKKIPATANSRFRIASVSKPLTAVGILKLRDQGKLQLDDAVLDHLPQVRKQIDAVVADFDSRWHKVTIRQLLQHRGGWDRDESFDPMFQSIRFASALGVPTPANANQVIQAMLSVPLDFDPDERYAYSNFGYCLLGRVIESISGKSYETFMQDNLFRSLGMTSLQIGKTLPELAATDEVRYYDSHQGRSVFDPQKSELVPSPYGAWYLEAMDAHGGWIASVVDLMRFTAALDVPGQSHLLKPTSLEEMFARPEKANSEAPVYYSLGWSNRVLKDGRLNHWHTGSLPGTTAILIRRHDGFSFAALVNTRETPTDKKLSSELDSMLHRAVNSVTHWPQGNLFNSLR